MKFKSTYLKLTLFYVLIITLISISFSVVIYNISTSELKRGLNRQEGILQQLPPNYFLPNGFQSFESLRLQQLQESSRNLKLNLFYFNVLIFILSAGVSYFWARRTMRPIEVAMETQNRFTADASHELRTPLTAMRTEVEVNLRDPQLNLSQAKSLLASNLEEIGKLEALAGALLKIAKHDGVAKITFQNVSLEQVLVEAYEKVASLASKKSIEFENHFEDILVHGDKNSLVELFVILLDNAIKYSPEHAKVFINMEKEKHQALVTIKDQGIGIKASDLPYIFNRFYRADTSRSKNKIDGYGLGLSIAKNIVELHQGTISAESQPGQGSEFFVRLPLSRI